MRIMKVARYIIYLSWREEEYEITPLKLQKILYYCQGFSYLWDNQKLFEEDFEAWEYGPVNREVYYEFRKYGQSIIPKYEGEDYTKNTESKDTIEAVWNNFKRYSAFDLVAMTHAEKPWREAYNNRGVISKGTIKMYFKHNYR